MMDEESAKLLANALILYFLFDVRAEDIRDKDVRKKYLDILETDLLPLKFLGISKIQDKLVYIILRE